MKENQPEHSVQPTQQRGKLSPLSKLVERPSLIFDFFEEELEQRGSWFIRLRWLAVIGSFGAYLIGKFVFNLLLLDFYIIGLIIFIVAYNTLFYFYDRHLWAKKKDITVTRSYHFFVHLQIFLDLVSLAALLHFTGGIENPFFFYFVFHMIIASILLRPVDSFIQATIAVVLINCVLFGEATGTLNHHPLGLFPQIGEYFTNFSFVTIYSIAICSTLYFAVFMATSITRQLRQKERDLHSITERLREQTRQLIEANRVLQELDARKSRFLRRVEHELRAPLSAVQSMLKIICDGYVESNPEKIKDLIARAEKRTLALLKMVGDLLHLSRLQDVSVPIKETRFDVVELFKGIYEYHKQIALEKEIQIEAHFPDKPVYIEADERQLDNVFTNVVNNAIKYTEKGGSVFVDVTTEGNNLKIKVKDTGIGIAEEDQGKIFEEFHRAPNAIEKGFAGSGLGLSIVKQIVENYGGTINVESELGKGSEFTINIPLKR